MATPIPYISTSRPLPAVMLVNVPFLLLRYSALRDLRPRGVQSLLLMSRMSGQPSPSASKKAAPAPKVSGRNFLPARPLLCVNLIPAALDISVNFTSLVDGFTAATPITIAKTASINQPPDRFPPWLPDPPSPRAHASPRGSAWRARPVCQRPEAGRFRVRESVCHTSYPPV